MNRAITGAWATGSSSSGSSRRNKISLNANPKSAAQSLDNNNNNGGPSGSASPAIAPITTTPWLVPETLPPGSAAAAAATREQQMNEDGTIIQVISAEGSTPITEAAGEDTPEKESIEVSSNAALLMKRKSRMASSNTVDQSNTASPAGAKRRKGGSGLRDGFGGGSTSKSSSNATMPTARLKDLGGVTNALDKILELIAMPLCHPEIYSHTGVKPPRGVLLHGPPGCGKTMLAGALAGELNVPLLSISSPSIVSGTSGESEQTLRKLFDEAITLAPCILFLDEIDAITPKRETASREMERRIVAQLLTLLDDLTWDKTDGKPVMVIGATNRPDSLDPALRRAGRFDHEIALGVPDEAGREEILKILCNGLRLSGDFDLRSLAKQTPGYVGADLVALTAAAGIRAVKRIFSELAEEGKDIDMNDEQMIESETNTVSQPTENGASNSTEQADTPSTPIANEEQMVHPSSHALPSASLFEALPPSLRTSAIATFLRYHPTPLSATQLERLQISPEDFLDALPSIQPSSKREGFATVPEVTWSDIGALEATREELEMTIVEPIKHPELFKAIGVSNSGGVLLWAPPGCGKTLLAKAVANESGANFISVKGPELLNKYVGESERAVRQVFARARTSSPCVIFFDELDALVPRRDDSLSESSSRVVNTLLTELDGLEARVQTYVIGATNRPDMIDPAMCRPGRLDKLLYVDLPNTLERIKILMTLTQKTPLQRQEGQYAESMQSFGAEVQAEFIKASQGGIGWLCGIAMDTRCDGFSGADLAALVREASVLALREQLKVRKEMIANGMEAQDLQDSQLNERRNGATFSTGVRNANLQVLVGVPHFHAALDKTQPSVGVAQRRKYESLRSRLSGLPGASNATRSATRPGAERGIDGDLAS